MLIVEQNQDNYCACNWDLIEIDSEGQRWTIGHINAKHNADILAYLYNQERPKDESPKDCNISDGDIQCSATIKSSSYSHSCCRYIEGHPGKHKTSYDNGKEW